MKNKDLLLRDLCARLPYGVKVQIIKNNQLGTYTLYPSDIDSFKHNFQDIKPYLRPLSSMTDEERHEIQEILGKDVEIPDDFIHIIDSSRKSFSFIEIQAVFDYLNAHHLDYRGLIEKGLALPVPEGMYNEIKEEKK